MKHNSSFLSKYNAKFVRHYNLYSFLLMRDNGRADFMNLGYLPANLPFELEVQDLSNKKSISLYAKILEEINTQKPNSILEISSGLGGGCYLLKHYYHIPQITGVDFAKFNVKYSNKKFNEIGIQFHRYSSDNVDQLNQKFDALLSVEASQHYDDWQKFLENAGKLLNPGGRFYYADLFTPGDLQIIEKLITETGWEMEKREDISEGVIESIAQVSPPQKSKFYKFICFVLHLNSINEFEAYNDSTFHRLFKNRELIYMRYVLKRKG